jgi:hypothetical protein
MAPRTPTRRSSLSVQPSERTAPTNVVDGFSDRFNVLLDRAGLPETNRPSAVAKRFQVVLNTAKHWCLSDRIPQTHADLARIVQDLLRDIPTHIDARAVIAWLLAGDAVPHPFGDDDSLGVVELYLEIAEFAQRQGVEFSELPRDERDVILRTVRARLGARSIGDGQPQLDARTRKALAGMLATGRALHRTT